MGRLHSRYAKAVGTDAEAMEKLSPIQAAGPRVPWLFGTMVIALMKELATSFLMAIVCGLVLGSIGAIWGKHLPFGLVIGGAMTCSTLTAALMGTIIPMISKHFGFDPVATAGPLETAFQDIIGFAVFLCLASLLLNWIS